MSGKELPRVIEVCGGVSGLEELAKAFKKKKGTDYRQFSEQLGINDLNLADFNIEDANFRLKKVPRIYADIYEHHLEPNKRSIDLLTRKYISK